MYKDIVEPLVKDWNAKGRQTIIKGEYKTVLYTVIDEDTTIQAKQMSGNLLTIKKSFQDNFMGEVTNKEIIGFTVEGDLENQLPPEVYNQLIQLPGIHSEANPQVYLAYVESLKNESTTTLIIE
jgi:hypothetical protein